MQQQNTDNSFLVHILWAYEACFTRDAVFNHHNRNMWFQVISYAIQEQTHLERWSVNVLVGIFGDRLLGPYLLPERLSGQSYLVFLNDFLTEFLDGIPLAAIRGFWFQHDGEPAHFCDSVRDWLHMAYPGRWIGRFGSCFMAVMIARSYTIGFFPMGLSQGIYVSRRSSCTNGLSCLSACCLHFGGHSAAATCAVIHSTSCSSLPRYARRTL